MCFKCILVFLRVFKITVCSLGLFNMSLQMQKKERLHKGGSYMFLLPRKREDVSTAERLGRVIMGNFHFICRQI